MSNTTYYLPDGSSYTLGDLSDERKRYARVRDSVQAQL